MVEVTENSILKKRYVLEEVLAADSIGITYLSLDLRQQEAGVEEDHVAIKVLNESVVANTGLLFSIQEEYSRTRPLQCENIVTIYDHDRDDDIHFVVMELLDGETLDACLSRRNKRLPRDEAFAIIEGICKGLEIAHKRQVLHTSLTPAKVFYTAGKVAKLFDFGIADLLPDPPQPSIYASPGKLETGITSESDDVFSVAVICYELLAGRHPFGGEPARTESAAPRRIWTLMPGKWRAVARGLAINPSDRTSSVSAFASELFNH